MIELKEAILQCPDRLIIGPFSESGIDLLTNPDANKWFESLDPQTKAELLADNDGFRMGESRSLLEIVTKSIYEVPYLKIGGVYRRRFEKGEGEGEHRDDHDIVVTRTTGGSALFTLKIGNGIEPRLLGDGDILVFKGDLPHEVGPARGARRIIEAVGIDLVQA